MELAEFVFVLSLLALILIKIGKIELPDFTVEVGKRSLREALKRAKAQSPPTELRAEPKGSHTMPLDVTIVRLWMQVAITAVMLVAALLLIFLRKEDTDAQKWAFGTVGLILGFWLK